MADVYYGFEGKFKQFIFDFLTEVMNQEFPGAEYDPVIIDEIATVITEEQFADFAEGVLDQFSNEMEDYLENDVTLPDGVTEGMLKKVVRGGKVIMKKVRTVKKRLTAKQKAALKKAQKKAHTGAAKKNRMKSLKIRKRKLGEAFVNVGASCVVTEPFEVVVDEGKGVNIVLEKGYMLSFIDVDENVISLDIYDDTGELVQEDILVTPDFVKLCFDEQVLESLADYGVTFDDAFLQSVNDSRGMSNDFRASRVLEGIEGVDRDNNSSDEDDENNDDNAFAHMKLGHTNESGYYVVRNGRRYNLGSRVRARSFLVKEGVEVDSSCFEDAFNNEITLR
jgi:hypothetical protein